MNQNRKNSLSNVKATALKLIPAVFYALLIFFLILYIQTIDFTELQRVEVAWPYLIVSLGLAVAFRYLGAVIWLDILKGLGARDITDKTALFYVYAKSWLGRYIPGTAPWILGKIYFAAKYGISKHKLAVSSLLEAGLQIVTILVLSGAMLLIDPRLGSIDGELKAVMIVLIILGVVTLMPPVFNRIVGVAYKVVKKKQFPAEHRATGKIILRGSLLYGVGAILNGLAAFFVAKALYPELGFENAVFVISAANLAGVVGMLALFAPSGIGVREAVLLVLLAFIMPPEIAVAVVVLMRLWDVVSDFVFLGVARLCKRT